MNKIDLSIIIPAYNVERWIEQCIESIVGIEINNYEIIIVNDGSTDRTEKILDKYKKNKPFNIIHTKNFGVSSARNLGLKKAQGEFICFVDSDDTINAESLKKMIHIASKENADIVVAESNFFLEHNPTALKPITPETKRNNLSKLKTGLPFLTYCLDNELTSRLVIWDKIYKKSFLSDNNITFLEGLVHEDIAFSIETLIACSKLIYLDTNYYNYRKRENSIMSSISKRNGDDIIKIVIYLDEKLKKINLNDRTINGYLIFKLHDAIKLNSIPSLPLVLYFLSTPCTIKKKGLCVFILLKVIFSKVSDRFTDIG